MTVAVAIVAVVLAIAVLASGGGPLLALVPLIVGAIVALRLGYRNQATAVQRALHEDLAIRSSVAPVASPVASAVQPKPAPDPLATLGQLAALRDRGAITDEEYEAKKAEILGRV